MKIATRIPSTSSLIAFEAAARHGSFTRAALELSLTQSAVSHQVRSLEEYLGFQLFERIRQKVILTQSGRTYLNDVAAALGRITEGTSRALASGGREVLNLAIVPTFTAKWLMPRISDFLAKNPHVHLNFSVRIRPFQERDEPFDAAIYYGMEPIWPGCAYEHLIDEHAIPMASPGLVREHGLSEPRDLLKLPLLQRQARPNAWLQWFSNLGVDADVIVRGPRFDNSIIVSEAAKAGIGVGLLPYFLFENEIKSGSLQICFPHELEESFGYYFVYREENTSNKTLISFRDWLVEEIRSTRPGP